MRVLARCGVAWPSQGLTPPGGLAQAWRASSRLGGGGSSTLSDSDPPSGLHIGNGRGRPAIAIASRVSLASLLSALFRMRDYCTSCPAWCGKPQAPLRARHASPASPPTRRPVSGRRHGRVGAPGCPCPTALGAAGLGRPAARQPGPARWTPSSRVTTPRRPRPPRSCPSRTQRLRATRA